MGDISAGHLLVKCLVEQGVETAFGVPGESYLDVLDGFHAYKEQIRFVICRQEGGAAFMAEAHGKLTRRPGVCLVTRGPGATNAAIGIHTAFQDSTPMVLLVGDVGSDCRDREAFQEIDFGAMFGPSTKGMAKRVERIDDPLRIPEYIQRAFACAINGRPGPVVLVLPEDMLVARVPADTPVCPRVEPSPAALGQDDLYRIRDLLQAAARPLVIAGGGWTPAGAAALQRFAENWRLPVGNAFRFQDTFDNHHPCYAGDVGIGVSPKLAARVRDSDLIIAIGPRLGEMTTGAYTLIQSPRPLQKLIHIHASPEELQRVFGAELAILAGSDQAAQQLAQLKPTGEIAWSDWTAAARTEYEQHTAAACRSAEQVLADDAKLGPIDMAAIIGSLQRMLPADAVVTNGAGNFASWVHRYFRFHGLAKGAKTQLAPTVGAMGYGVPAGVAASLVSGRVVFTIAGDGDFMMNGQELATARQYGGKPIIMVVNNGTYGTIRMHQERNYPGNVCGTDLVNPDFCALARAYGFASTRVERTAEFEPAFAQALAADTGTLIEVMLSEQVLTTGPSLDDIRAEGLRKQKAS